MGGVEGPVWDPFRCVSSLHKFGNSVSLRIPSSGHPLRAIESSVECNVSRILGSFSPTLSLSLYHVFDRIKIRSWLLVWEEKEDDE